MIPDLSDLSSEKKKFIGQSEINKNNINSCTSTLTSTQ